MPFAVNVLNGFDGTIKTIACFQVCSSIEERSIARFEASTLPLDAEEMYRDFQATNR